MGTAVPLAGATSTLLVLAAVPEEEALVRETFLTNGAAERLLSRMNADMLL